MKNYQDMTEKEYKNFLKNASAKELIEAFCQGKSSNQIENDIKIAEKLGA